MSAGDAVAPSTDSVGPSATPRITLPRWPVVACSLLCAGLAAPAIYNALFRIQEWTGPSDFAGHAEAVGWVLPDWWRPALPHFPIHVATKALAQVIGDNDFRLSMVIVTAVSVGAFGGLLCRFFLAALAPIGRAASSLAAIGLAASVVFAESPAALYQLEGWGHQWGPPFFLPLNALNNPTHLGSHVFGLALLMATASVFRSPVSSRHLTLLAPLTVVATFVKPNYAPFLAAAALVWAFFGRTRPHRQQRIRAMGLRLALPAALVLVAQWFIFANWMPPEFTRTTVIAPFRDLLLLGGDTAFFWAVAAFPLVAFLLYGRSMMSPTVVLAAGALGFHLIAAVLLGLDPMSYGADSVWTAHIGFLLLTVAVIHRACELTAEDPHRWRWRAVALGAAWTPSVLSGLALWSCHGGGPCILG